MRFYFFIDKNIAFCACFFLGGGGKNNPSFNTIATLFSYEILQVLHEILRYMLFDIMLFDIIIF